MMQARSDNGRHRNALLIYFFVYICLLNHLNIRGNGRKRLMTRAVKCVATSSGTACSPVCTYTPISKNALSGVLLYPSVYDRALS